MNQLSNSDISIIEKLLGHEYISRYKGLLAKADNSVVRVVNTGLVSSGKSSLFNVLIDKCQDDYFATGAARTTIASSEYQIDNIVFVDTPGIDVRDEDDETAFDTVMSADIIIMVHNIRTGPLNRSEGEWLRSIVNKIDNVNMLEKRLIFVCSWKDTRDRDSDYDEIINEVRNQVVEITGTADISFVDVSTTRYLKGLEKNADKMIEQSNVLKLKNEIKFFAENYAKIKKENNNQDMDALLLEIRKKLVSISDAEKLKVKNAEEKCEQKFKPRFNAWKSVIDTFRDMRESYSKDAKKLTELY